MKKHFLSIGMIVRDEEDLPEFIEFHLLNGVDHFYITEHKPTGHLLPVLDSYIKDDLVTYNSNYSNHPQLPVYRTILDKYGKESEWIAFIDADEYLFCNAPETTLKEVLLSLPDTCGAYAVHWTLFGSNSHRFRMPDLVIKRFTKRAAVTNQHVKSIVRPRLTETTGKNPHCFYLKKGAIALRGEESTPLPTNYALMPNIVEEPLRLNHYHTKSEIEFKKKRLNPRADTGQLYTIEEVDMLFKAHDVNEVHDASAVIFAPKIRERLKARGLWND